MSTQKNVPGQTERTDKRSAEQRRALQQGFPVRSDAAHTYPSALRPNRRPIESGIPDSIRNGYIPVRHTAKDAYFPTEAPKLSSPLSFAEETPQAPSPTLLSSAADTGDSRTISQEDAPSSGWQAESDAATVVQTKNPMSVPPESEPVVSPENSLLSAATGDKTADEVSDIPENEEEAVVPTPAPERTEASGGASERDHDTILAALKLSAAEALAEATKEDALPADTSAASTASPASIEEIAEKTDDSEKAGTDPSPKDKKERKRTRQRMLWIAIAACIVLGSGLLLPAWLRHGAPQPSDTTEDTERGVGRPNANTNADPTETPTSDTNPAVSKLSVTLRFYDREDLILEGEAGTLASILQNAGYTPDSTDCFPIEMDTVLQEDTTLYVDKVVTQTETKIVEIPFREIVTEVQTIPRGEKEVITEGKTGEKQITYTVEYRNGEETRRTVSHVTVLSPAVDANSNVGIGGTLTGADGNTYSYSYYRTVRAVYYDGEGPTYLGPDADETCIATNIHTIPMGTRVYVKNDAYDFGPRVAADTASTIAEWEICIWLSDSNPQKNSLRQSGGVDDMRIYYLD